MFYRHWFIRTTLLLTATLFYATVATGEDRNDMPQLIWELTGLNNPESVIYDPQSHALYVSNVNGGPNDKDGNGYIAKVSTQGKLLKREWVSRLNAPKGLAIHGNTLYVADIDTLVVINIPTATITRRHKVDDAKFLNDVAAAHNGDVFVSDMVLNRIHRLSDDTFSIWLESPQLENPNGLLIEGDHLILGAWGVMTDGFATKIPGHLKSISLANKSITSLGGTPIGNLDGVESDYAGGYYVTDWMAGRLFQIDRRGNATLLLQLEMGTADIEVMMDGELILLPMMQTNQLRAYTIAK